MQQTINLNDIWQTIEANSDNGIDADELVLSAIAAHINPLIESGEITGHNEVSIIGLVNGQHRAMTPEEAMDILTRPDTTIEQVA